MYIYFSCDQATLKALVRPSVRPSVCLSVYLFVCHTFDYAPVIVSSWNYQDVLPLSEVKGQGHWYKNVAKCCRFRTVILGWIHRWLRNAAQSSKWHGRGVLLFSGSSVKSFLACNSRMNSQMAMKWCTKLEIAKKRGALLYLKGYLSIFKVMRLKTSSSSILTEVGCFRTATVSIHQWLRNYAQSLKYNIRGTLLFFKFIRQISRSRG